MIRYSSTVTIDRAPGDVLAAMLDADRYSQWTEMEDARFAGGGSPGVGTTGSFRFSRGPLKGTYAMNIVRLEPDRRVDIDVTGRGLTWRSTTILEPAGTGTRMTYAGEIRLHGWRRLLEPLMAREVGAGEAAEARRFKELLETDGSPVSQALPSMR